MDRPTGLQRAGHNWATKKKKKYFHFKDEETNVSLVYLSLRFIQGHIASKAPIQDPNPSKAGISVLSSKGWEQAFQREEGHSTWGEKSSSKPSMTKWKCKLNKQPMT